jgi:hypothetical protein
MAKVIMKDFKDLILDLVEAKKWPSSNMVIHDIDKMSTQHIVNCIKKIKRENWRKVYLPLFEFEIAQRLEKAKFELSILESLENA